MGILRIAWYGKISRKYIARETREKFFVSGAETQLSKWEGGGLNKLTCLFAIVVYTEVFMILLNHRTWVLIRNF